MEWIKCSERVPDDSGFYLVCCGELKNLSVGYAIKDIGFPNRDNVTHWQPMPSPPED